MSTGPRRSARLAAKQAVATAETALPAKEDEVVVSEDESSKRGGMKNDEEGGPEELEESEDDGGSSEASEHSRRRRKGRDGAERRLRAYSMYLATKDFVVETLPVPFRISNALVLKEPLLWPLLFDTIALKTTDLASPSGLDGDVVKAFLEGLAEAYRRLPEAELAEHRRVLKQVFRACGLCFVSIVKLSDPWQVFEALDVFLKQASAIFDAMDERLIALTSGGHAATAFSKSRRFANLSFPARSKSAVKAAARACTRRNTGRECNRCHAMVYTSFRDHVCRPMQSDGKQENAAQGGGGDSKRRRPRG